MNARRAVVVRAIFLVSLCIANSAAWAQAPPGQTCDAITPAIIDAYANQISEVVRLTERDVAANGSDGEYAVAANNSRNYALKALGFARDAASFLRSATPETTHYAEASTVKDYIRSILETMPAAAHWAIVSTVYHDSEDARLAFEGSMNVLHRGHELFAEASRCYIEPYLGDDDEATVGAASASTANTSAPLLLHLTFDGVLKNLGSIPETPLLFVKEGDATPDYVEGRFGQALHFASSAAVVLPFALDSDEYPRVTVTAWVKEDVGARDTRAILQAGVPGGLMFGINGGHATLMPGGVSPGSSRIPANEWVFVAAVLDRPATVGRVHQGGSVQAKDGINMVSKPARTFPNLLDPTADRSSYLTIGAYAFYPWGGAVRAMAIDDVRLYAGALSVDEVNAIRTGATPNSGGSTTGRPQTNTDGIIDAANDGRPPALPGGSPSGRPETDTDGIIDAANEGRPPDLDSAGGGQSDGSEAESASDSNNETYKISFGPTGEPKYSGVSGYSGDSSKVLDLEGEFIRQIIWKESGDRPCTITIDGFDAYASLEEIQTITVQFGSCSMSTAPRKSVSLPVESQMMIGRIEVCNNDNNKHRLKGIRIGGDVPNDDGSTTYSPDVDNEELANCAEWSIAQLCPDKTYATGLVVHADKDGSNESLVGLQLICREIVVRRTAQ